NLGATVGMWSELSRCPQHLFERDNVVHPDAKERAAREKAAAIFPHPQRRGAWWCAFCPRCNVAEPTASLFRGNVGCGDENSSERGVIKREHREPQPKKTVDRLF